MSTKRALFAVLALSSLSQLVMAQEFRSTSFANSASQPVTVDLTSLNNANDASVSVRNSSGAWIQLPALFNPGAVPPYNISYIQQQLPPTHSDKDLAIATWQFVNNHLSHYCSAGTVINGLQYYTEDPELIFNAFGFACCDQAARSLVWIWLQLGYQARLAVFPFHTVAEIYYGNRWHMFDSDHHAYYVLSDGETVASVADILADPQIIVQQSHDGLDPIGFPAQEMADLYQEYANDLEDLTSGFLQNEGLSLNLRPFEEIVMHSDNLGATAQKWLISQDNAKYFSFDFVNTAELNWDISFGQSYWSTWAYSINGVNVVTESSGAKNLQAVGSSGNVIYRESSIFPVLALSVAAQVPAAGGTLQAYISTDAIRWSGPVTFQSTSEISSYQQVADLTNLASGLYTYYVKIELQGPIQLHKIRISPLVQAGKSFIPQLEANMANQLAYSDASPQSQQRNMRITTQIPTGDPQIVGLQAVSLIPEHPIYSLGRDHGAANLVDGDPDSMAYPSSTAHARYFDYVVQLGGTHIVTGVSIDWGIFGTDSQFITAWELEGRVGTGNWQVLATGYFPGQYTSDISLNTTAAELRLRANGNNSIGVYEMRVFGRLPDSSPVPLTITASDNEVEYPSNPLWGPVGNLADGNDNTCASPPGVSLDYTLDPGQLTQVDSVLVYWGPYYSQYIASWALLGLPDNSTTWEVISHGVLPHSEQMTIPVKNTYRQMRMTAQSVGPEIGICEVQVSGNVVQDNLLQGPLVQSLEQCNDFSLTDELPPWRRYESYVSHRNCRGIFVESSQQLTER